MSDNKEIGYVYILTNPSFREDWVKIGKSSRPVDVRSKELDNTAVPLPFEIFATIKTVKYNEVEINKLLNKLVDITEKEKKGILPDKCENVRICQYCPYVDFCKFDLKGD